MKKLLLTLIVPLVFGGSIFAQNHTSHWAAFNSGPFEMWDAIVAFIKIDGTYVTDNWEDFEVASFIDGECRGHAFLRMEEDITYPCVELPVYRMDSIVGDGEEVSFKLFDHVNGIEYVACTSSIPIITGTDYDDLYLEDYDNAVVLNFAAIVTQTISLAAGWNRISIYVDVDPEDPEAAVAMLDMFKEGLGENGQVIEGPTGDFTEFDGEEWFGDLDEMGMYNEYMYMVMVASDCTVELEGKPADMSSIQIQIEPGWNRIGFPSSEEIDLVDALSDFESEEGDVIEDPDGYSEYDGEDWFGDVETLMPGRGYMYFNSTDDTKVLVFAAGGSTKSRHAIPISGKHFNHQGLVRVVGPTKSIVGPTKSIDGPTKSIDGTTTKK